MIIIVANNVLADGVTVVLYNVMRALCGLDVVTGLDVFLGVLSFFSVAMGGLLIGLIVGALSAFILRFTSHVKGIHFHLKSGTRIW